MQDKIEQKSKQYKSNSNKGFTFIELIISMSIIAILSILWFISYSKNLEDSRDSQRKSDLSLVSNALESFKLKRWSYPIPWNNYNITNNWYIVALQWKLDENIILSTIDKIPKDPFINIPYVYSVTKNNKEFQLSATLENNWVRKALLVWDYKVVSKNILPTITLALYWSGNIEIANWIWSGSENRTKFVFNNWIHNLPYTFLDSFLPYSDGTSFTWLIDDITIEFTQNNDYKNCNEIINAEKNIWTGEYQVNNFGSLENITCFSSLIPKNCKEIKKSNPSALSWIYNIMPEWVSRTFSGYCDMSTASWWWTLVAKAWSTFNYTIGHCSFMDPPTSTIKESSFIYWACDLNQTEILFSTPSWWVVWTNKDKEDCSINTTRNNNNTCSWTGSWETFKIMEKWWCMSSISPINWWLWWKWWNWETTVTKNLSWLSTVFSWACNNASWEADTSYCSLFDIYDVIWNGIWQWWGYRNANCLGWYTSSLISSEQHLIFVR